ncbi:MAG: hypothetical protein DRJ47_04880 [Thermoprotei archaeon]|nr:MAG: hypothetical protein DRJ47_04880 [Thermoprotei archaeon]
MTSELSYKPISVKDLLRGLKNASWLMVNLAYSAVLYNDPQFANEVLVLEKAVDRMELLLMMQASLATRKAEEAERMVSIFRLASATSRISNAAADIAKVAFIRVKIPKGAFESFFGGGEMLARIKVDDTLAGKKIGEVFTEIDAIVDVLTVRRGLKIILEPSRSFILRKGDYLIVKGNCEAVTRLLKYSGTQPEEPRIPEERIAPYRDVIESLLQIRNTALTMIDIAYTAMLTKSEDIAEKVEELEEYVDAMLEEFSNKILESEHLPTSEKYGLLRIAFSSEEIADGALAIVQPLLLGLEPHPLISDVLGETLERISVVEMDEEDENKTLMELGYSRKGVSVLVVKRNDEWWIMPPYSTFKVKKGDILIVKYIPESQEFVEELEKEEDRREIIEDIQEEEWEEE